MTGKRLLVVGASGDVGQGIVAAAVEAGWRVIAAARDEDRLESLRAACGGPELAIAAGDLGSEDGAHALWSVAASRFGGIDAAVVAVNAPNASRPLLEWSPTDLLGVFATNVMTHFVAAKTFIPRLPAAGAFIGIGGGTADFVIPNKGQLSMAQAALRMLYRTLARECRGAGPAIRELMIVSMVNAPGKHSSADPSWITGIEVGRHLCAIVADPARFPGPILTLKSTEQVGKPDAAAPA